MDKEEMQEIWDLNLINCWKIDCSTNQLIVRFILEVAPVFIKIRTINQLLDYSTEKLRMRTLEFHEIKMPVRAFVANHSPQLSGYLWDTEFNPEMVAEHIDNFKWFKKRKVNTKYSAMKQKEKRRLTSTRYISVRARDKGHDWATVK